MHSFKDLFKGKKSVLILGFGKEGRSTYRFLSGNFPDLRLAIADRNTAIAEEKLPAVLHLGEDYLQAVSEYDLIIKSPGVLLGNITENTEAKITSQTDLFLRVYGHQTIGVTGTKGKSTTASLLYHLLQKTGKKALLLGNIGLPAFDFLEKITPETIVVYELSAHQLERVHNSPHVAVLLNIFPEHLDYFGTFEKYRQAKLNILRFQKQGDSAFCGEDLGYYSARCISPAFSDSVFDPEDLLDRAGLKGMHNLKNILMTFRVLHLMGIPYELLPKALSGFSALPHRLEYVGNYGGIDFYNDSISTVPQSTMAAVKSIPKVDTLILGGYDRGLDYTELVHFLTETDIKNFFFLGKAGDRMMRLFEKQPLSRQLFRVKDLPAVFSLLQKIPDASCCLLSPAAASYDQFHNFEHRGDLFKKLAQDFGK
jgi:UDP-N-acetylmuramoylalanine--D-glutamate ligase